MPGTGGGDVDLGTDAGPHASCPLLTLRRSLTRCPHGVTRDNVLTGESRGRKSGGSALLLGSALDFCHCHCGGDMETMRFYFLFFLVGLCSLAAPDGRDEGSPGEQAGGRTWGHAGWWHNSKRGHMGTWGCEGGVAG